MTDEPTESAPGPLAFPDPGGNGFADDGDPLLLEAEGRARGAESRAAALEGELASIRERSALMDEQFEQLRVQLQALSGAVVAGSSALDPEQSDYEEGMYGAHTTVWSEGGPSVEAPAWDESDDPSPAGWEDRPAAETPAAPSREDPPEAEAAATSWDHGPAAEAPSPNSSEQWGRPPEQSSSVPLASPDPTALAGEQIAGLLQAAQQAAKRIVDTAQASVQAQLAEMSRQREALDSEARELAAWRDQARSLIGSLSSDVEAFRAGLGEIPQRLSQAFAPLAERIPAMQKEMAELVGALGSASSLFPTAGSPEDRQRLAG